MVYILNAMRHAPRFLLDFETLILTLVAAVGKYGSKRHGVRVGKGKSCKVKELVCGESARGPGRNGGQMK